MVNDHYLLVGGEVMPCTLMEWAQRFEDGKHRIVQQDKVNDFYVSTVFLGLDHGFPNNPDAPLVFESMIFAMEHDEVSDWGDLYCTRCSTLAQAEAMHTMGLAFVADGSAQEALETRKRDRNQTEHTIGVSDGDE